MICERCGKEKPDVCERPDGYRQDVDNEEDAVWVACDECDEINNDCIKTPLFGGFCYRE